MNNELDIRGVRILPDFLDTYTQLGMVEDLRALVRAAPLFHPETPYGKRMSVKMTSAGRVGWISDRTGYRYAPTHPSGTPWPPVPASIADVWQTVTGLSRAADCCLINYYSEAAKMGMHQDRDEKDFSWPVVSISLGDDALFRIGNTTRGGKTSSMWLRSGDIAVMEGKARLIYHGIDRVRHGSSSLLPQGGRINITLRVVS